MTTLFTLLLLLLAGLLVGLASYYTTRLLRVACKDLGKRFPAFERIVSCKPLACDVCMSFWAALPWAIYLTLVVGLSWTFFPLLMFSSAGIALRLPRN